MKKTKKKEECVSLGKGGWNVAYVRSFTSCDDFVRANMDKTCSNDIEDYLKSVWDLCHKNEQLKSAEKVSEKVVENSEPKQPEIPVVKKTSTNKKSTNKKE